MKPSFKITFLLLTIISISTISCTKSDKTAGKIPSDSLVAKLEILHDSLDHSWKVMIDDDDEKIQFMKRLLQEVSYTGSYDEKRFQELMNAVEQLKAIRYDRQSMRESQLIDRYDSATNEVSRQVVSFTYESPAYNESDLMKRLVNEIADKNGMVLIYRVHYDAFAEEINDILTKHGGEIDTAGQSWKILPLFRLPPDEI